MLFPCQISPLTWKILFFCFFKASHEFSDAVFAGAAHPFVRDVLHFSDREAESEEGEERVNDREGEEEEEEEKRRRRRRRKRVRISQVYLDLKRKQVRGNLKK